MPFPEIPTLRDLYPTLSDGELSEAEDNLDRYLALVLRIFEGLQAQAGDLAPGTGTLAFRQPGEVRSPGLPPT